MKSIQITVSLAFSLCVLVLFSSCESSKVAFGNAYYFKQTPKSVAQAPKTDSAPLEKAEAIEILEHESSEEATEAFVSTENVAAVKSIEKKVEQVKEKMMKVKELQAEEKTAANVNLSKAEKKALKKERKAEQKELKKEIKALAKEYKSAPEEVKKQADVTGNLRTGIILGAAGLILLIIGTPVLYAIGTVLVILGLVFVLLDVL